MQRVKLSALWAVAVILLAGTQATANLLVNPSFEDPITSDGAPFVGFWEGFAGGGASSTRDTVMPRTGQGHLALAIDNTNNTFAGAFQDVEGLSPGQLMNFNLWHKTPSLPYSLISEVRIEWRKTGQVPEVSRTPNLVIPPTLDYTPVSLVAPVPAGADTARVVYAIQSFDNTGLPDIGTVYVDDASLTVIPEPATLAVLATSAVGLLSVRRRSRWSMR
jgi:hypothetical protein